MSQGTKILAVIQQSTNSINLSSICLSQIKLCISKVTFQKCVDWLVFVWIVTYYMNSRSQKERAVQSSVIPQQFCVHSRTTMQFACCIVQYIYALCVLWYSVGTTQLNMHYQTVCIKQHNLQFYAPVLFTISILAASILWTPIYQMYNQDTRECLYIECILTMRKQGLWAHKI